MPKKIMDELESFCRCYIATPTVVTVHADGRHNAMTAVWHSTLSFKTPLCGVSNAFKSKGGFVLSSLTHPTP